MRPAKAGRPIVAHFVFPYLSLTCNWIHTQLMTMRRFQPIVVTDEVLNRELFPFAPLLSYGDLGLIKKTLLALRYRRRHGLRELFYERTLRRRLPRLIHCHFGDTGADMAWLRARTGLPLVTTFYGADVSQVPREEGWRERYQDLFACGDLFLAEGTTMVKALINLGCPSEKVVLHRLGVDLGNLPFRVREPEPDGIVRILIAGTFREKKGIPDALGAVAELTRRHLRVRVTLVGDAGAKAGDNNEKQRILTILEELRGVVSWRGFLPYGAFRDALYSHDIFLSPSRTATDGDTEGGAPVSLIEAQATGMPIVSTRHADIPEIVLDGTSGLLSQEGDAQALASNLERLVTDTSRWAPMGRAGREHVEANHDLHRQVSRLEDHYSALTKPHPSD